MTCFVIGNGPSRNIVDLHQLKKYGTTYGSNAIHRDYIPDYLVAIDTPMVTEILKNNVDKQTKFYTTSYDWHTSLEGNINFLTDFVKNSSGITCVKLAVETHNTIYILGFDYIGSTDRIIRNIYDDTNNYPNVETRKPIDVKWEQSLFDIAKEHSNKQFIIVTDNNIETTHINLSTLQVEDFLKQYNVKKEQPNEISIS